MLFTRKICHYRGLLLAFLQTTALWTMVAAVFIQLDFNVRLLQLHIVKQLELHVSNRQTALHPHRFIIGADGQYLLRLFVNAIGMI